MTDVILASRNRFRASAKAITAKENTIHVSTRISAPTSFDAMKKTVSI